MTPSELLAWARATAPDESAWFLACYAALLESGCSAAFLRAATRVNLAEQARLTPMGLDTAPPLDVTEPVSVQPETMR